QRQHRMNALPQQEIPQPVVLRLSYVRNLDGGPAQGAHAYTCLAEAKLRLVQSLDHFVAHAVARVRHEYFDSSVILVDRSLVRLRKLHCVGNNGEEHGLEVEGGTHGLTDFSEGPELVAVGFGLHLRTEADDSLVEGGRQLADLVSRCHRHQFRQVPVTDSLGDADEMGHRLSEAPGEESGDKDGHPRDTAEGEEKEQPGPGAGGTDDRLVHPYPDGAEVASEHRNPDVDDLLLRAGDRIRVLDLSHLLPDRAGHEMFLDDAAWNARRERVSD